MKHIINLIQIFIYILVGSYAMAQSTNYRQDLTMFPKPEVGYKQMVIDVPHSDKDDQKKIEFTIGKFLEVDKCNQHGLSGELTSKDLSGWGYSYYVFKTNGAVRSTLMGCPDNSKETKFVASSSELINYNGRMPVVIYVPEDCEVQFKIYQSDGDIYRANEIQQKK